MVNNLSKIHYSLDNVLQMLREKDVFDLSVIKLGVVEPNGRISIYKKTSKSPILREDMGLEVKNDNIPYPIIIEGKIDYDTLNDLGANENWLMEQLNKKGIKKVGEVFFASLTSDLKLHISPINDATPRYIKH